MTEQWLKQLPAAVTVCDAAGKIIYMNEQAGQNFAKDGGKELVGKNVYDCHPESARNKIKDLLENKATNCYTIEKNGSRKLIYQAPWYDNDVCKGIVEIILELPGELPHYVRK